ncbi:hypothetical protein Hanom_Chr06g00539451 [Helianthus anomalus]
MFNLGCSRFRLVSAQFGPSWFWFGLCFHTVLQVRFGSGPVRVQSTLVKQGQTSQHVRLTGQSWSTGVSVSVKGSQHLSRDWFRVRIWFEFCGTVGPGQFSSMFRSTGQRKTR